MISLEVIRHMDEHEDDLDAAPRSSFEVSDALGLDDEVWLTIDLPGEHQVSLRVTRHDDALVVDSLVFAPGGPEDGEEAGSILVELPEAVAS